jgi:molecular chaperone HscB
MDYFEALGISPKLALDLDDLQRRFYARSREWHPDRHARAPEEQRVHAEEMTATLNDAWRTLRDPVRRAEYVLRLQGLDAPAEQRSRAVPPELLEEVFELNMALEEAREGDGAARSQVESALARFEAMLTQIDGDRDELFRAIDDSAGSGRLPELRALLDRRKYIQNLVTEARQSLSS